MWKMQRFAGFRHMCPYFNAVIILNCFIRRSLCFFSSLLLFNTVFDLWLLALAPTSGVRRNDYWRWLPVAGRPSLTCALVQCLEKKTWTKGKFSNFRNRKMYNIESSYTIKYLVLLTSSFCTYILGNNGLLVHISICSNFFRSNIITTDILILQCTL